ncbi:MAG: ThuA domain-containing protein [Fibrobacteria bacterium]
MIRTIGTVVATVLVMVFTATAALKKILVTNFCYDAWCHPEGMTKGVELLQTLGKANGFEVKLITSHNSLTPDQLTGVDVLVLLNMTDPGGVSPAFQTAAQKFVEVDGKGIFSIHSTLGNGVKTWQWLTDKNIHATYVQHSAVLPAKMVIDPEADLGAGKLHPVLNGLKDLSNVKDGVISGWTEEWFNWNEYFRGKANARILLSMDLKSYNCACTIRDDHPALWVTDSVGKGRTLYFLGGHGTEVHSTARGKGLDLLWLNSMKWLAGEFDPTTSIEAGDRPILTRLEGLRIEGSHVDLAGAGRHTVKVHDLSGRKVLTLTGEGAQSYDLSYLIARQGTYVVKVAASGRSFAPQKVHLQGF